LRGYDKRRVDEFLDEYEARLNLAAGVTAPAQPTPAEPAPPTAAQGSKAQRGRLAHIPQRRWRRICVAFWVGLALWVVIVSVAVGAFWPKDSAGGALWGVFLAAGAAVLVFSVAGVSRTEQMDPSEWTTTQRVLKWINDHSNSA
jgi:peptidoglycan/LPS O-acetylase OafA/YrhL